MNKKFVIVPERKIPALSNTVNALKTGNRPGEIIALGGYPIDMHRPDDLIIKKVPP